MRHLANAQYWDRPAGGNTGRLFLAFGGPVCADRFSNCPLDRVLTYKNLIYLLNLQFNLKPNMLMNQISINCPSFNMHPKVIISNPNYNVAETAFSPCRTFAHLILYFLFILITIFTNLHECIIPAINWPRFESQRSLIQVMFKENS